MSPAFIGGGHRISRGYGHEPAVLQHGEFFWPRSIATIGIVSDCDVLADLTLFLIEPGRIAKRRPA